MFLNLFSGVIILYFGIILIIGMISNFVTRTMPKVTKSLFKVNLVILFRKRISLPALAGYRRDTPLKYGIFNASLPTRAQSIILFSYFTITVTFLSIGYDLYDGNTRYQTKTIQFTRYLGDRAGILATAHLPMIFLFAGRNNIMLWLTNWSFTTMSVYHKWISRMLFVLVAIHGACFYTHYKLLNKFQLMEELYVAWGIVAAISVTLIIVCSIRHIRERVYDLFLLGHQILVILFVVGAWRHLQPHGYLEWMYASIAIWAFDRVCRVARVALSGLRARANCKVYSNEIIKMKIDYSSTWLPRAGSYVFVSFLKPTWKFWESHPFSIYPSTVAGEENKLVVCLKKANGKTKQLVDYLSTNKESYDGGIIPVWLDGPYGQRFPIEKSDTVVFMAGGMGITAIYSYAVEMMKISEKKHLKFNWIIQDESYTDWFRDELEYLIMSGLMEVSIYISRSKKKLLEKGNINNNIDKSNSNNAKCQQQKNIEQEKIENHQQPKEWDLKIKSHIYYERPNLTGLVDSAISEAVPGSIAFMTCGPDRMNDEVRKIITSELKEGRGNIDLFTESFSY